MNSSIDLRSKAQAACRRAGQQATPVNGFEGKPRVKTALDPTTIARMSEDDSDSVDIVAVQSERPEPGYACSDCGLVDAQPRVSMFGGGMSGSHRCFCRWDVEPNGPICVAMGVCCYRIDPHASAAHLQDQRRWALLKSPLSVDWDEVAARVNSTRRVDGDLLVEEGWPEPSPDHGRLLSAAHRREHWPAGSSETLFDRQHRRQMAATADEIAEWLMLARDRITYGSASVFEGSAEVHAAGDLLRRLSEALVAWDTWRAERVIADGARVRRILAAAAFRWGGDVRMFRAFVGTHFDAAIARKLPQHAIAVLACAMLMRRRGRPRKHDPVARALKEDLGLAPNEEVPDKIEALQRLGASVGIPRVSPKAVEDQVQPLLARLVEIRRQRAEALADVHGREFDSFAAAFSVAEDADITAAVQEDEAIRVYGSRQKTTRKAGKKGSGSRPIGKARRTR